MGNESFSLSKEEVNKLSYEQAFSELDEIVQVLENEQLALEETMSLYERGQNLIQRCTYLLEAAEMKLEVLGESTIPLDDMDEDH